MKWTYLGCGNNLYRFKNWRLFTSNQLVDEVSGAWFRSCAATLGQWEMWVCNQEPSGFFFTRPWLSLHRHHEADTCRWEWICCLTAIGWKAGKLATNMNCPLSGWIQLTLAMKDFSSGAIVGLHFQFDSLKDVPGKYIYSYLYILHCHCRMPPWWFDADVCHQLKPPSIASQDC